MKKTLVTAMAFGLAVSAFGATLPKDSHEFILDVATDFDNKDRNATPPLYGAVGYFLEDNLEAGGYLSMRKTKSESYWGQDTTWGLGVFGEADFYSENLFIPFVSGRAGVLMGGGNSQTVADLAAGVGFRVYLTERFCVTVQGEGEYASKDVFDYDLNETGTAGTGSHWSVSARAGVRYLF